MELLFVIIYFIFWIAYYILEGIHDANIILWKQATANPILTTDQKALNEKYNQNWHEYDAYEKALTHIAITASIFFIGGSIWLFLSLILMSVSIRILIHNYCINKFMNIDVNYIGTTDWFDLFMRKLEDKGISQWTVKFVLLGISILLVILFLFI